MVITARNEPETAVENKEKILIVDDEKIVRRSLNKYLTMNGFSCEEAGNAEEAMEYLNNKTADLVILDIMMPFWTGLDILEELRKRGEKVPVLLLSARNTTPDKVEGLGLGADDYMTKPFDLPELIARIKVMLRRR